MRLGFFLRVICLTVLAVPAWAVEVTLSLTPDDADLRARLRGASLVAGQVESGTTQPADLLAAARADYSRLLSVLYAQARYGPQIRILADGAEVSTIPAFRPPSRLSRIRIVVRQGPAFAFGTAQAAPLAPGTSLPDGFATGQPAGTAVISNAAQAAISGWRDKGHAKATVSGQSIQADHRTSTLDTRLTLAPGPQLRFGTVTLSGESRVRDERLREIAGLPVGKVFSPAELDRAAERLRDTGVFRSVSLTEAEAIGPGDTQDIDIAVVDEKRRRMGAGIELSSLEGLTLSALWMHRNLREGAERLRIEGEVGGIGGESGGQDLSLSARFDRPATFTPDTGFYAATTIEDLDEPDFSERRLLLETGLTHRFSDKRSGSLGLRFQTSRFTDDLGTRSRQFLMLPGQMTWDGRNDKLNAFSGTYLDVEAMPIIGLGGAGVGARMAVDARTYYGFGADDQHVAALRLHGGSVIGLAQVDIPPTLLFFSGGGGTVRGQPYQSLAVDLGGGDSIGGRSFLGLSAELRIAVTDTIGVVGFTDIGMIGSGAFGGDTASHSGAGLGVRYNTGLGPIRFDIAAPISGDTGDGVQFYIGIGQAF